MRPVSEMLGISREDENSSHMQNMKQKTLLYSQSLALDTALALLGTLLFTSSTHGGNKKPDKNGANLAQLSVISD